MPVRSPPTPWVNAVHPLTQDAYKFRLVRTRKAGKITLETAKDSPTAPRQVRCVVPSRIGWWEFVQAAQRLLATSVWDTATNIDSPYAVALWHKSKQDYQTHAVDVAIIVTFVPQLLDPRQARSIAAQLRAARKAALNGGTHPSGTAARTNRYGEIMLAMHKILALTAPLQERLQDARRMRGYSKGEVDGIADHLNLVIGATKALQRAARGNTLDPETPLTHLEQRTRGEPAVAHPITDFMVDDVGLSAPERAIAQEQARQDVPRVHVGAAAANAAAAAAADDDEDPFAGVVELVPGFALTTGGM